MYKTPFLERLVSFSVPTGHIYLLGGRASVVVGKVWISLLVLTKTPVVVIV